MIDTCDRIGRLLNISISSQCKRKETMFRSVEMSRIQLYIPYEHFHSTLSILGELECVEFDDVILNLIIYYLVKFRS